MLLIVLILCGFFCTSLKAPTPRKVLRVIPVSWLRFDLFKISERPSESWFA